jgi:hypothetical protein
MGRSEGAVKSLYHRTLLALRNEIEGVNLNEEMSDKSNTSHKSNRSDL